MVKDVGGSRGKKLDKKTIKWIADVARKSGAPLWSEETIPIWYELINSPPHTKVLK